MKKIILVITVIVTVIAFGVSLNHMPLTKIDINDVKHEVFHSQVTTTLDRKTLDRSLFKLDSDSINEKMRLKYKSLQQVDENEFQLELYVTKNLSLKEGKSYFLYFENDAKSNIQVYRLSETPDLEYELHQSIAWLFLLMSVAMAIMLVLNRK